MPHAIRTWNVFHGNAQPPRRRSYLLPAIGLAVQGAPTVACLQELPVWSLRHLPAWTGYRAFAAVARRGLSPAPAAGWVTRQWQGLLRSGIAGQANAILVRPGLGARPAGEAQVSDGPRERRVVHAVRVDGVGLVATTHLTQGDPDAARAELGRAVGFLEGLAREGERVVLAGDLNLRADELPRLPGWEGGGPGVDHVLVRGGPPPASPDVWPVERRMHNGLVLSDHPPVEVRLP